MELQGKVALITGGTRGIGLEIAHRLADLGSDLILVFKKDQTNADAAKEALEAKGRRVQLISADLRKEAGINSVFEEITTGLNQIDILVLNAAFGTMGDVIRVGQAAWRATYDTNVLSPMLTAKAALPWLKKAGGVIVGTSTLGAHTAYPTYVAIGSSRAAFETLIKYLAFEWAQYGIRANSVAAGPVNTRAIEWFRHPEAVRIFTAKKGLAGRMGQPDDIADVAAFLCTDASRWIWGQTLLAEGGILCGVDYDDWMEENVDRNEFAADERPEASA
ncbi:MAG: SDR family oxidoreductase [Proteobacteria bacterium]|nr:SDR family oxidoreductase [Pseudomonadota bacterium]